MTVKAIAYDVIEDERGVAYVCLDGGELPPLAERRAFAVREGDGWLEVDFGDEFRFRLNNPPDFLRRHLADAGGLPVIEVLEQPENLPEGVENIGDDENPAVGYVLVAVSDDTK